MTEIHVVHGSRKCLYTVGALILSISQIILFSAQNWFFGSYLKGQRSKPWDSLPSDRFLSARNRARNFPTFLWGIPTVDDDKERRRRQVIRETYLSFYKNDTQNPRRICSLNDLLREKISFEDCQVAYAFFMGANPRGPTQLLFPNKTFPILTNLPNTSNVRQEEDDIVYLNIVENQFEGKMPTWFKYASMIADDARFPFDYIAKVDSDTLVFIPTFLQFAAVHLSDTARLVHAGFPFFGDNCIKNDTQHDHPCPVPLTGEVYMSGELSVMSSNLAKIMTSKECNRSGLYIRHEDILLSNWAFHCAATTTDSKVHVVPFRQHQILRNRNNVDGWQHKFPHRYSYTLLAHATDWTRGYYKNITLFRQAWDDFLGYWHNASVAKTTVRYYLNSSFASWGRCLSVANKQVGRCHKQVQDIYELPNANAPYDAVRKSDGLDYSPEQPTSALNCDVLIVVSFSTEANGAVG